MDTKGAGPYPRVLIQENLVVYQVPRRCYAAGLGATFGGPLAKGDAFGDKLGESHGLLAPPGVISCVERDAGIYLCYPGGLWSQLSNSLLCSETHRSTQG